MPTEPALVAIVTTATGIEPSEPAGTYRRPSPIQENVIWEWLIPLGLDVNHGYSKVSVPNSEAEKKRVALEKRTTNARQCAEKARLTSLRAQRTSDRQGKRAKACDRAEYSELNGRSYAMEGEGLSSREYRARMKEFVAPVEVEVEGYWHSHYRAHDRCSREYDKRHKYWQEQRALLRELEDLNAGEHRM